MPKAKSEPSTARKKPPVPANCIECGKLFSRKSDLPRHMKTHQHPGEPKEFVCDYPTCTYQTHQKSNLKTHSNIHSGDKFYKCTISDCSFATTDPSSLNRHRGSKKHAPDTSVRSVHRHERKSGSEARVASESVRPKRARRTIQREESPAPEGASTPAVSTSSQTCEEHTPAIEIPYPKDYPRNSANGVRASAASPAVYSQESTYVDPRLITNPYIQLQVPQQFTERFTAFQTRGFRAASGFESGMFVPQYTNAANPFSPLDPRNAWMYR